MTSKVPKDVKKKAARKTVRKKSVGGRPSKFNAAVHIEIAEKLAKLGLTDKEMADVFGVSEQTLNTWKKRHPKFLESLNSGKAIADMQVAEKLFQRATGYEHPEDDIRAVNGEIVITPTIKHYPPDTTAGIFWLKNRQRTKWRDKIDHGHENPDGSPLSMTIKVEHVAPGDD